MAAVPVVHSVTHPREALLGATRRVLDISSCTPPECPEGACHSGAVAVARAFSSLVAPGALAQKRFTGLRSRAPSRVQPTPGHTMGRCGARVDWNERSVRTHLERGEVEAGQDGHRLRPSMRS